MTLIHQLEQLTQQEIEKLYQKNRGVFMYAVKDDLVVNKIQIRKGKDGFRLRCNGSLYLFKNKSSAVTLAIMNGKNQSLIQRLDQKLSRAKADSHEYKIRSQTTSTSFKKRLYEMRYEESRCTIDFVLRQYSDMAKRRF